jgi:hypothetical protein
VALLVACCDYLSVILLTIWPSSRIVVQNQVVGVSLELDCHYGPVRPLPSGKNETVTLQYEAKASRTVNLSEHVVSSR